MQSFKNTLVIVAVVLGATILPGCSEDPETKASKEARAACEEAISIMQSTGDMEKARAALGKVQASMLRGKDLAQVVAMVRGSVLFEEAIAKAQGVLTGETPSEGLATLAKHQADAMQSLSAKLYDYKKLDSDKARLEQTMKSAQESLAKLKELLEGSTGEGLETQLAMAQAELSNLETEKGQWQAKADAAIGEANKLQAEAQEFFTRADLARGDERESLKQKGYDVLLGRGGGESKDAILVRAQAAADQVSLVESKMQVVRARVKALAESVRQTKESIAALNVTVAGQQLKVSMNEIASQQAKLNSEIGTQLAAVEKARDAYLLLSEEVTGVYNQACEEYSQAANSRGGTPGAARFALADCQYRSALRMAGIAASHESLGLRAEMLCKLASDGYTLKKLKEMADAHAEKGEEMLKSALALTGEACENFKSATVTGRAAKCAAVSNNVLAYLERLRLAAKLKDKTAMEGMVEELKGLAERGKECDENFAQTTAGRMLTAALAGPGGVSKAPSPAVEQAKTAIRQGIEQILALPEEQRAAGISVMRSQAVQMGLDATQLAAFDAMMASGAIDEALVTALAEKAMAMAAKAVTESPDQVKAALKSQLKQQLEAVFAMQGAERQAVEETMKKDLAELGLSEDELKAISDMLAAGSIDESVLDMLVAKSLAAISGGAEPAAERPAVEQPASATEVAADANSVRTADPNEGN